jgi:pyruvate,water dikinase
MRTTPAHTTTPGVQTQGGKGANLLRLQDAGYPVPPFVIIPSDGFTEGGNLAPGMLEMVKNFFSGDAVVAVRSSAAVEDHAAHSFAGQFATKLNVPMHWVEAAIKDVWQSGFSQGVATYKKIHRVEAAPQMAVVVQQMVPARASGVAFGINPLTGAAGEKVINAVTGLGEGLVNGSLDADTYTITGHGVLKKLSSQSASPVLSDAQIAFVANLLDEVKQLYGTPQDIEFSYVDEAFYLLQSRPVTTLTQKETIIWDNSNIVESYPGLTLPLTFSFIQKMYEAVYRQFSAVMGVRGSVVQQNEGVYANMLGLLNGRVYYNLNNWFRALAQLPGYSINAAYMERMMGVKEKFPLQVVEAKKPGVRDYIHIVTALSSMIKNLRGARRGRDAFIRFFDAIFEKYNSQDFLKMPLADVLHQYRQFEQLMVKEWKAPLVNDFFAMIYFGLLQKMTTQYAPAHTGLHNELVAFSNDVITTQPAKLLPRIAALVAQHEDLKKLFKEEKPESIIQQLSQPAYSQVKEAFDYYINVWGDRSVAELKLETTTYRQNPALLIQVLHSYVQQEIYEYKEVQKGSDRRHKAEQVMLQALKGAPLRRRLYQHVLKQARYFVTNRENLRYYRTKGFGMVRRMLLAAGQHLQRQGILAEANDIFYLELEEVFAAGRNQFTADQLMDLVSSRKQDYTRFESLPLPERVTTNGAPQKFILLPAPMETTEATPDALAGQACSPGVVQGTVRLITHPSQIDRLNGDILATYSTDPGWVVLFPSAAGILTERGSLLSHAAIVSREMGLPCIVGIPNLMQRLQDGDEIIMDASTGIIKILNR